MTITSLRDWRTDKTWADRFMPEAKRIIGEHLICEDPIEDRLRNTDLMVGDRSFLLRGTRIGVRFRKSIYLDSYSHQYTIRTERPVSGNETELTKIIKGYGDYFLYGIADKDDESLACWVLIDLSEWRLWYQRELYAGNHPGDERANDDGSSLFIAFNIADLPDLAIAARREYEPSEDWLVAF